MMPHPSFSEQTNAVGMPSPYLPSEGGKRQEDMDVPTFIRRQAD
jgi:hypothetical protein